MNTDIATAAAWRPTDLAVQLGKVADQEKREDVILKRFDDKLHAIRTRFLHTNYPGWDPEDRIVHLRGRLRHRAQARAMWVALARVTTELTGAGIDVQHTWRDGRAS